MSKKSDMYYFETLKASAGFACKAADYLVECLSNFDRSNINVMLQKMHEYEHSGDIKNHEINEMLAKAFVTPVDREDIALISANIDNVTDSIEEVLQRIYMCRIQTILPEAILFAKTLSKACHYMKDMLGEFVNFKKPEKLHKYIVELNHFEDECDELYIKSFHSLDSKLDNMLDIMSWRDILGKMERSADACEHVGDNVNMVVMKNS